jgi:integrase
MVVALNFHRRHSANCEGKHTEKSYTAQAEERKKGWVRCHCLIYASGSLGRVARRMATKTADWQAATQIMAPYIAANSWTLDSPPPSPLPSGTAVEPPSPPTLRRADGGIVVPITTATKAYLAEHRNAQSAAGTVRKYGYLMARVEQFSANVGLRTIDEWTPALVRQFRDDWNVSPLTAQKQLGNLKAFFEFCLENEWIGRNVRNPARIKTRQNRALKANDSDQRQKMPFTDEELERMYAGCREYGNTLVREWPKKRDGRQVEAVSIYRNYQRTWTGEDLADFVSVSVYTGLRISDVATFHATRLDANGNVKIRTTKGGGIVATWVPPWLADRIRARAVRVGPLIFGAHRTTDINVITDLWRRKLIALWEQCGHWTVHPTPHRFRHTFARILLQNGTPVSTVAELMGNTEAIVRKHYAAWVPERQENTTAILKTAFHNSPNPHTPRTPSKVRIIKQG